MRRKYYIDFAEKILSGEIPDREVLKELAKIPEKDVFRLFPGADMIRDFYFHREIHLCTICNAKSGRCSEDCAFCSQSSHARTDAPVYPLLEEKDLQEGALAASTSPITRYSWVTSGKRLSKREIVALADAIEGLDSRAMHFCASLGTLDLEDFEILKKAGVTRYHHNLETCEGLFSRICTTHGYGERVETIVKAKQAGLSVCAGGIFGVGETDEQALELALSLRELKVDAVPLNFLSPIKGTRLESCHGLTPLRCLKIIAMFRYVLPDKDIYICGGREANLKDLHPLIFYAGASGIMTGNYLTTEGRTLEKDLEMIEQLQLEVREHSTTVLAKRSRSV